MTPLREVVDAIITPWYCVGYEQRADTTFVHVAVRKWNAAIARQFREDIDTAQALLGKTVYALDHPDSPNLKKFLRLHNFISRRFVTDIQGRVVEEFERPLQHGRRRID